MKIALTCQVRRRLSDQRENSTESMKNFVNAGQLTRADLGRRSNPIAA